MATFDYHEIANLVGQLGLFDHREAARQLQDLKDEQPDGAIDPDRHTELLQGIKISPAGLADGFYAAYLKTQQDLNFRGYSPLGALPDQVPESF